MDDEARSNDWRPARILSRTPVKNAQGDHSVVLEMEFVAAELTGRTRKYIQFALDTGEVGEFLDRATFQLASSGERFRVVGGRN